MSLEDRVGKVELEQARQGQDLRHLSGEVASVKASVGEVGHDVKQLLTREARRPAAVTLQTVAMTCAGLASIAAVVWWLIGTSPAVTELGRRMDRLDDPQVGRVPAIERRLETLIGWHPTRVTKGR
jgi:hypothetical protein